MLVTCPALLQVFVVSGAKFHTKWWAFPYPVWAHCLRIIPTNFRLSQDQQLHAHFMGCGRVDPYSLQWLNMSAMASQLTSFVVHLFYWNLILSYLWIDDPYTCIHQDCSNGIWAIVILQQCNGPLTRYAKLRVAHAPGMPGTFSPPPRVSDPDMHHSTCVTHVPWCLPGSLISSIVGSWL